MINRRRKPRLYLNTAIVIDDARGSISAAPHVSLIEPRCNTRQGICRYLCKLLHVGGLVFTVEAWRACRACTVLRLVACSALLLVFLTVRGLFGIVVR